MKPQRLIDAQDAFNVLTDYYHHKSSTQHLALQEALNKVPTADAQPVRHGKWIRQTDTRFGEMLNDILICSECNIAFPTVNMIRRSYCPNCGSRMDAE